MKPLPECVVDALIGNREMSSQQRTIYVFGLHQLGVTVLNLVVALFIAALFGMVFQMIVFLVAYIPLRQVAGGYHAKTEVRCFFTSVIMEIAALSVIRFCAPYTTACILTLFAAGLFILFIAPVDNQNHRLDDDEKIVYQQRTILLVMVSWTVAVALIAVGNSKIMMSIAVALFFLAIMLGLGWVKNCTST